MSEEKKEEKPKATSPPQATAEAQKQSAPPQQPVAQARQAAPPAPVPPGSFKPLSQPGTTPRAPVTPGQVTGSSTPPAATSAPRPAMPVPPPRPVPPQAAPKKVERRGFIKFLSVVGGLLTLVPFVPFGQFLSASVAGSGTYKKQKVVIDNNPSLWGSAAGKAVDARDLTTFAPNSAWIVTYPTSGDSTRDAQNPDTFVKFRLIRLPTELGGKNADASAFVAFSEVCVHLWCSPNYIPDHKDYECPCHGSVYRLPDGRSVEGPASIQPPPTNAIPVLTLSSTSDGSLFIEPPIWDIDHNGVVGYGRYLYDSGTVNKYKFEGGESAN